MKPIDMIPGFGPERTVIETPDGTFKVTVKPPKMFGGGPGRTITLTPDQYERYKKWTGANQGGTLMIQDALPELSDSEREALMTGLGDATFETSEEE